MQTQNTGESDVQTDSAVAILDEISVVEPTAKNHTAPTVDRVPPRSLQEIQETGIHPDVPTEAKPGTEAKVRLLSARYEAGLPLWNDGDRLDHGPGDRPGIDLLSLAPMAIDDNGDPGKDEVDEED
jgi:hypothetical protein